MSSSIAFRPAVGTTLILLVPLTLTLLNQHTPVGVGWHWSPMDFVVMGVLLFGAGLSYEFIARKLGSKTHKVALGVIILGVVLAIWSELAVGAISQVVTAITA